MAQETRFEVNGRPVSIPADGSSMLLWALRTELGLTGAKYACGEGHCGACTVLVDERPVRACVTPVRALEGRHVTTVEGLARDGVLHPLQQAFIDHGALQCGFCTPGMLLAAVALLARDPHPAPERIRQGLEGHLCRCGSHVRILEAVNAVARGAGAPPPASR